MAPGELNLLELDNNCLGVVVRALGLHRRVAMLVCKRLRDLAQASCHTYQQPQQSVMDAIELAAPGDTVHLLPGAYKEAILLKKPLHLTCDGGQARILSPARFAIMCNAAGCLLENLVLKSHQIDESVFYLVEYGPACHYTQLRRCEVLQGSYIGIQDLKGPGTRMVLDHCDLHVGVSLMAGRLDMLDCTMKCTADSVWSYPGSTLVMRRCQFIDISDAIFIESRTAVVENCNIWAYDRGPYCVTDTTLAPEEVAEGQRTDAINNRLLYLEDQPPVDVWISLPARIKATGRRASEEQRAAVLRGELVEGHVVMWGNTAFESRSNEGISAQQEEVRREARQLMLMMQREFDVQEGLDPDELSIGNSVENPVANEEDAQGFEDEGWGDSDTDSDMDSDIDSDSGSDPGWMGGNEGDIIDLLSSGDDDLLEGGMDEADSSSGDSLPGGSSSSDSEGGGGGDGEGQQGGSGGEDGQAGAAAQDRGAGGSGANGSDGGSEWETASSASDDSLGKKT